MEKSNLKAANGQGDEYMVRANARTKDGYVLGLYETYAYAKTREGLEKAVKRFGIETVVESLNAQLKTRARNDAARPSKAPALKKAKELRKSLSSHEEQEKFDKDLLEYLTKREAGSI